jgi:uncharacterized protein (DUF342 family)
MMDTAHLRVPIHRLRVGMFVEAEVIDLLVQGEFRGYLELTEATYLAETTKRLRLKDDKRDQVGAAGGMLITLPKQIDALREICVSELVVNTEQSEVVPDEGFADEDGIDDVAELPELPELPKPVEVSMETQRRRNFGPNKTGWMKLEMSERGDRATLQTLSFGGDASLGEADVLRALEEEYGIRAGTEEVVLRKLVQQAAAAPNRVIRGSFPIAQPTQPSQGPLGHIEYTCLQSIAGADSLPHTAVGEAWEKKSLDGVESTDLRALVVLPGEELAVFVPEGEPEQHQRIYGTEISTAVAEGVLRAGANVTLTAGKYISDIYGNLHLSEGEISVLSPVWVSDDRMKAEFVLLPSCGPRPDLTWAALSQLLEQQSVRYGLRESSLDYLQSTLQVEAAWTVEVAKGRRPDSDEPGRVAWGTAAIAAQDPDGELDMAGRHRATSVRKEQLLTECRPARKGGYGIDLAGLRVFDPPGQQEALKSGVNVRVIQDEETGVRRYYATTDGVVQVRDSVLWVHPLVVVEGDIADQLCTFEPGHDVLIMGGVRSGAIVRADGTVSITGVVESGASVHGQEDVLVERGIIGNGTKVVALGNVQTRFVQSGSVAAQGDVTVCGHLVNAQVRAGGQLRVNGEGGRDGTIVGGWALASSGVEARQVGAAMASGTVVSIGTSLNIAAQLRKLDKGIEFCRTNIKRIFRSLGLKGIDAACLKQFIDRTPQEKRESAMRLLEQLKQLVDTQKKSMKKRQELEKEQVRILQEAKIRVSDKVFADVQIRMGEETLKVTEDLRRPVFFKTPDGIHWYTEE